MSRLLDREEAADEIVSRLEAIVVEHPQFLEAEHNMRSMIRHGRRSSGKDKQCMNLTGPTGCGKSTILLHFIEKLRSERKSEEREIPALYVKLKPTTGKRSLAKDILAALADVSGRDTKPEMGTENDLLERTQKYLTAAGCELLVIDEFHHVLLSDTEKKKKAISETVKWLLLSGPCPIVVAGMPKAEEPFRENDQLLRRAKASMRLKVLSSDSREDRQWFGKFFGQYFKSMEEMAIATNATSFLLDQTLSYLIEASDGVIGNATKILTAAVTEMALGARNQLLSEDFRRGCNTLVVGNTSIKCNPWERGLRGMKVSRAA